MASSLPKKRQGTHPMPVSNFLCGRAAQDKIYDSERKAGEKN
jgi:hypothetical protein